MTFLRDLCAYCRKSVPVALACGAWTVAGRVCMTCWSTFGRVHNTAQGDE